VLSWTQLDTVGDDVATYSNTGLTCGTTYYYRVRANNAGGDSGYSDITNAKTAACYFYTYLPLILDFGQP
jgi:hypothetical protein